MSNVAPLFDNSINPNHSKIRDLSKSICPSRILENIVTIFAYSFPAIKNEFLTKKTFFADFDNVQQLRKDYNYKILTIWNERFVWNEISAKDFEIICENIIENISYLYYEVFNFSKNQSDIESLIRHIEYFSSKIINRVA